MSFRFGIPGFIAVAAGILTAAGCGFCSLIWLFAGLSGITLALILYILKYQLPWWVIPVCFFFCGGFLLAVNREVYRAELRINQAYSGKVLTLEGVQIERTIPTGYGYRFILRVKPLKNGGPVGRISVTSRNPVPPAWYGRYLRITGRFKAVAGTSAPWPGTMERRRISGVCYCVTRPQLCSPPRNGLPFYYLWAGWLREVLMRQGNKVLSPANARLLHGMIYNDRLNRSDDAAIVADLRRTGTIHLLSVSGLHIGFIVIGLNFLLNWLRCPKKWRIVPLGAGVWFYILMTGMEPPVLRAGLMMLIFGAGELLGTRDSNINRLSLAGLILILGNPFILFEVGFQLSFLATLGVVWIYPLLKEYFPAAGYGNHPFIKPVREGLLVSLGAQSLAIPVIVAYFQMISWSSAPVNLILLVPAEIIVIGGLTGELLGALIPVAGRVVLTGVDWLLNFTRFILEFFGGQPWSATAVPRWPWPWFIAYYVGLLVLLDWLRPNQLTGKRVIQTGVVVIAVLVIFNGVIWSVALDRACNDYLQVSCLDVGQGDTTFIKTPDGFTALVDGGDKGKGTWSVLPFLRQMGVYHLDVVIVTHGHQDHTAGLAEVLAELPARKIILPARNTPDIHRFLARLPAVKLERMSPDQAHVLQLGRSVKLEILNTSLPESENDQSLVTVIHYGKERLLLTGDLGLEGELVLMRKYPRVLQAAFLKVGHHGSNLATGLEFLTQVRPKLAVISVGAGNEFGHPGAGTLNRLRSMGVQVYRTDRNGRVDVRVKGKKWVVLRER